MTRPAGTTPNGLPYPGSVDIHARTPAALQALAEAVEARLTAQAPGVIMDTWRGPVAVSTFGGSYGSFVVVFPRLAAITGWIAAVENLPDAFLTCGAAGNGYVVVAPWVKARPPSSITVCALGWGPPR
jgi:hypothetical protein